MLILYLQHKLVDPSDIWKPVYKIIQPFCWVASPLVLLVAMIYGIGTGETFSYNGKPYPLVAIGVFRLLILWYNVMEDNQTVISFRMASGRDRSLHDASVCFA